MESDWQINLTKIKDRGQYLLQSEKMVDCRFFVGNESNETIIAGHRLLLAMASPVFESTFYGSLQEKDDPIIVPDVQPNAFRAMLNYIYTDEISISSFDDACDLFYVANKYLLSHLVEHCKQFLLSNLSPKNACRTYVFAKLNEEPRLIESSMQCFTTNTLEVITDPSFMDIEVSTLMTILDQDLLSIDSEVDLFNCLLKFANERGILNDGDKDNKTDADSKNASDVVKKFKLAPEEGLNSDVASTSAATSNVSNVADEMVEVNSSASASGNAGESPADVNNLIEAHRNNTIDEAILRQAVKKIRFLAMTPQEFTEGPARSKLLQKNEVLAILTKLVSPTLDDCSMPEGFCQSTKRERDDSDHKEISRFCKWAETILDADEFDYSTENICRLTFKVNTNIYLLGVQIELNEPCQDEDIKDFSECILNMGESKIACTSSIKKLADSVYQLTFNSPVYLYRNQNYSIGVINKHRYSIDMYTWDREEVSKGAKFSILELDPQHKDLGSAMYSIIFSTRNLVN